MQNRSFLLGLLVLLLVACAKDNPNYQQDAADPELLHRSVKELTNVIVHDIFSPPVAGRIYAYSTIAAYEAMAPGYPGYQRLEGQLNGLEPGPKPETGQVYCYPVAGLQALLTTGKALIFSEDKMQAYMDQLAADMQAIHIPKDVYERSVAYGTAVAQHIIDWSKKDNYSQTRTFPKYTLTGEPSKWQPTPPDYMDALEPHWNKIRPLTLDSAAQFKPAPPTPYDTTPGSQYMKEVMDVYNVIKEQQTEERTAIAKFWDCNPYVSHHAGHVMFATKKITPGGHWINITAIACRQNKTDIMESARAYVTVAISVMDGFISCWDEKFRSEATRPETVINKFIDEEWRPLLQTPPFPEYTSGHSVVSGAASTALTAIFGDKISYTDDTEEEFGMPARTFTSFRQAAEEASISRMYGGIHYRPALDNGLEQGRAVSSWVLSKVKTK